MARALLVVFGASGVGKTTAVHTLASTVPDDVRCHYFDDIGVPTPDVMERDFGGGEAWQADATRRWITQLAADTPAVSCAVLEGQTRPRFVLDAVRLTTLRHLRMVLLDCATETRAARLAGPRGQPELHTPRMDAWAAYLRGQADALELPVIDTTGRTIEAIAAELRHHVIELLAAAKSAL